MFLTRVELYGSHQAGDDYTQLHAEMEKRGFSRKIKSDNGRWFHLPAAEYWATSDTLAVEQIRDLALAAAKAVGYVPWPGSIGSKDCAVIVALAPSLSWNGLKEAA